MYKNHNSWYRITPKPSETLAPPIIQPLTHPTWKYSSPSSLATSGIYTNEDLDRLRMHIMFPVEKPSMLNTLARGAMGGRIPAGSISIVNLLDEESLNRIAESAGERLWKGFVTFGSASAGVLAIFIIIWVAKLIIDTIIHGYALHSVDGWSVHLLAAIWSSVTNLLLHTENRSRKEPTTTKEDKETAATPQTHSADASHSNERNNHNSTVDRPQYSYLRRYSKDSTSCANPTQNAGV